MDQSKIAALWARLKDDTTFRVATLYAGASWFVVQLADTLGAEPSTVRIIAVLLLAVFLVAVPALLYVQRKARPVSEGSAAPEGDAPSGPTGVGRRRWAIALAGLLLVTGGLWGFGVRLSGSPVPEAAAHLAVLPFRASGSGEVREFGVGVVDLLSTALSDVGGIRTVPSRTVFATLGRSGEPGTLTLEEELALGRALGAGSVLTGGVTAFGANVRLTAEIREVVRGEVLARAELDGSPGEILTLTDRLAMALLRELWRSRAPLPTVRVAAITTSSPSALREYLRGEEHLRAMRFDSAVVAYRRALEGDSTFPLAWIRLADAVSWADAAGEDVPTRREYTARAVALSDRLPERERAFARAHQMALLGSYQAFDSLDAYVRRNPDDPMGWYHLGDARFHAGFLGRFSDEEIIGPFLESARLDPALGLGLHHVVDMALESGDRELFHQAFERYASFAAEAQVERLRRQAELRWAPPAEAASAFARMIRTLHPLEDRLTIGNLVGVMGKRARLDPEMDPMMYVQSMDSLRAAHGTDRFWATRAAWLRATAFAAMGRMEDCLQAVDDWLDTRPAGLPPLAPHVLRALMRVEFSVDQRAPHLVAEDVSLLEAHAQESMRIQDALHVHYLSIGDQAAAARFRGGLEIPPEMQHIDTLGLRMSYEGYITVLHGDTARGLADVDLGLEMLGFEDARLFGIPWHKLGMVLVTIPERRQEGIRMLRWTVRNWATETGEVYLALARALEASGDLDGARDAYGHVLRLWAVADPVRDQDKEEAREALVRLGPGRGG